MNALTTAVNGGYGLYIYSGAFPLSPDITISSGLLLCNLPCSVTFGTVTYFVQAASLNNGGHGGTNGTQTVTGTTGTGTKFQASVTVSGGAITAVLSITVAGSYSVLPSNLTAEPVTGGGLSSATLSLAMSSMLTANPITASTAISTGTAGFARISGSAGSAGFVDLDVGTSGTSVIINTTSIVAGGQVVVSSCVFSEA